MIVARVPLHQPVQAEILCLAGIRRGHDIPRRAAAAHVIQRGEAAGDVERVVERGGQRAGQADMPRLARHRRQQQHRVEVPHLARAGHLSGEAALVGIEQRQHIDEEQRVELARLEDLRDALVAPRVQREIGVALRMAPGAVVVPGRPGDQVADEMHLPRRHQPAPSRLRSVRPIGPPWQSRSRRLPRSRTLAAIRVAANTRCGGTIVWALDPDRGDDRRASFPARAVRA